MNKEEVQQRVLQDGKPLDINLFEWDEKTKTFTTAEDNLVIDFRGLTGCNFNTGDNCTFNTSNNCTFNTWNNCTFNTGYDCVIVNRNVFEVIQPKDGDVIQICPYGIQGHLVNGLYNGEPHIIADGILSKIINKKGNVYKVINHGETEETWLIKDGDTYSHGTTLEQAKKDLIYKRCNRDKSEYEKMNLETVLTLEESIEMYRVITGACGQGTKYFIESLKDVKESYAIKEIIELTKGQYNNNLLVEFFKGEIKCQ